VNGVASVIAGIVIPVVIAGTGWYISDKQQELAKAQQEADRVAILLPSLASQNPQERELAFSLVNYYQSNNQLPNAVMPILSSVWGAEDRTGDASDTPTQVSLTTARVSDAENKVAQLLPRVYFHIASNSQREMARNLEAKLESSGFIVPGIQNVGNGPENSEVRYFWTQHGEAEEAQEIGEKLKEFGLEQLVVRFIPGYEDARIRPRHYELWISPNQPGG
jgi:hypothetical protein